MSIVFIEEHRMLLDKEEDDGEIWQCENCSYRLFISWPPPTLERKILVEAEDPLVAHSFSKGGLTLRATTTQ